MSVVIKYSIGRSVTWDMSQHNRVLRDYLSVIEIMVDGPELAHIIKIFTINGVLTIPLCDPVCMIWTGDIARTILVNAF